VMLGDAGQVQRARGVAGGGGGGGGWESGKNREGRKQDVNLNLDLDRVPAVAASRCCIRVRNLFAAIM
jgi:hypothetical protein